MKFKSASLLLVAVALLTLSTLVPPATQAAPNVGGLHAGIAPSSVRDIDGPWPVVRDIDGPWPVVRDIDGPWPIN